MLVQASFLGLSVAPELPASHDWRDLCLEVVARLRELELLSDPARRREELSAEQDLLDTGCSVCVAASLTCSVSSCQTLSTEFLSEI